MSVETWEELNKLPCRDFGVPLFRNNGDVILAVSCHTSTKDKALIKYLANADSCQVWIKYPDLFFSTNNTDAIDKERDVLIHFMNLCYILI